mmetsp:Transcript_90564/g.132462  ORF Transcript_90564/g.132462 Transcript_90564/m.132462 type:complete len:221 (-) Transcript_90564:1028-1690(-)
MLHVVQFLAQNPPSNLPKHRANSIYSNHDEGAEFGRRVAVRNEIIIQKHPNDTPRHASRDALQKQKHVRWPAEQAHSVPNARPIAHIQHGLTPLHRIFKRLANTGGGLVLNALHRLTCTLLLVCVLMARHAPTHHEGQPRRPVTATALCYGLLGTVLFLFLLSCAAVKRGVLFACTHFCLQFCLLHLLVPHFLRPSFWLCAEVNEKNQHNQTRSCNNHKW